MRIGRTLTGIAAAIAVASLVATVFPTEDALARKRKRKGGAMRLIDVNVGSTSGVVLNEILEFKFTADLDPSTVTHSIFQIREENETRTGFTKQVPGSFQVAGNTVRFFPRLPTHLRDPDDQAGGFYAAGTDRDNADENAGLQPSTNYRIRVLGHPETSPVRSGKGRRLNTTADVRFTTAPIDPRNYAYTTDTFQDSPPPGFQFSNPPDKVATVADQYAKHGGTEQVPNDLTVTLFGNKVPLQPSSVRKDGNIQLLLTERKGDPSLRKPMTGNLFLEQNFDTARIFFEPLFPLPDLGTYALRVTKDVRDLTGQFNYVNNAERLRLRAIYEFLTTARQLSPATPAEQLQDPPSDLIFDWPSDVAARGILKRNVLDLGDTYPDEVDPRVMVLFSTRDEPVSQGQLVVEFLKTDGAYDSDLSTATWDDDVPGAAAAIMTIAGGSAANGDFGPVGNETVNSDAYANNTINWRNLSIPPGVRVTITGSRPATLRALSMDIQGEIIADGQVGPNASTTGYSTGTPPLVRGGNGGPGGGDGADASRTVADGTSQTNGRGVTGTVGNDIDLVLADAEDGGRGGLGGGIVTTSTAYIMAGGGGGGGARLAGGPGAPGAGYYASWSGPGGAGGAGALGNDDLNPLVGGAGGGSGGNGAYVAYLWYKQGGPGGGGGGALTLQTASIMEIGTTGLIQSRGGRGGNGGGSSSTISGGPGGGGAGGSVLLRSSKSFDITDPGNATDVRGGPGGTQSGSYVSPNGGAGGDGFLRVEDPNNGLQLPGGTTGLFEPVGGGVASFVYSTWLDVGVDGPRFVNFGPQDFTMSSIDDAILIEVQAAIEDPLVLGAPKLDALLADQNTINTNEVSGWHPVRYVDNTSGATPAIPNIADYNPGVDGSDKIFDVAAKLNGFNFKFVRYRITFQLSDDHTPQDPLPYVDRLALNFEFNF